MVRIILGRSTPAASIGASYTATKAADRRHGGAAVGSGGFLVREFLKFVRSRTVHVAGPLCRVDFDTFEDRREPVWEREAVDRLDEGTVLIVHEDGAAATRRDA